MIIQTNLSKDEFIRIKDIKMGELAVMLTGSMMTSKDIDSLRQAVIHNDT